MLNNDRNIERFYIFCDVPTDNDKAVNWYSNLVWRLRNVKNAYVIPIICIEYFIALMFYRFGFYTSDKSVIGVLAKYMIEDIDIKGLLTQCNLSGLKINTIITCSAASEKKGDSYEHHSFEGLYKYLVNNQLYLICLKNKESSDRYPHRGDFYRIDCATCDKCKFSKSLEYKAEYLYTRLPLFDIISNEHKAILDEYGINCKKITKEELQINCVELFSKFGNGVCEIPIDFSSKCDI